MGCIYAKDPMEVNVPPAISNKICLDWMIVGRAFNKPYGMCPKKHWMFDRLLASNKEVITDFVVATEGVWFNQK